MPDVDIHSRWHVNGVSGDRAVRPVNPGNPGDPSGGTGVQAAMADKLVDFYGVIAHLERDSYKPMATIATLCAGMDLRHVRCRLFDGSNGARVLGAHAQIYAAGLAANGVGAQLWGPVGGYQNALDTAGSAGSLESVLDYVSNYSGASSWLEGLEGLNENNLQQGGANWDEADAEHTKRVKTKRDAIAATKAWFGNLKLIAASIGKKDAAAYTTLKDAYVAGSAQGSVEVGNGHLYTSGLTVGDFYLDTLVTQAHGVAGTVSGANKPIWMTEGGSHNAMNSTAAGDYPISEKADGLAEPKRVMEYFERSIYLLEDDGTTSKNPHGIVRCTKYELVNEGTSLTDKQQAYGLLRADLTPKPNYVSLKNLFALARDPGADFVPGKLPYKITGGPADLRHRLFQKRNGTFLLALWRHVEVWDRNKSDRTTADVTPTPATFKVQFDVLCNATPYVPTKQAAATGSATNGISVDVSLGGDVMVLSLVVLPVA